MWAAQKQDFPDGIPECGTDALRFALCSFLTEGRDINLDVLRIQGYRFFCNKLWNALRFALIQLGENFKPSQDVSSNDKVLGDMNEWILSRADFAMRECESGFRTYDFPKVTTACYNYWLYDLCDVYLECAKAVFMGPDATEPSKDTYRQILYTALDIGLRLISPLMPFISEELYQRLPRRTSDDPPSICVSPYPVPGKWFQWHDFELESRVDQMMRVVKTIRSLRADYNLAKTKVPVHIVCGSMTEKGVLEMYPIFIKALSNSSEVTVLGPEGSADIPKNAVMAPVRGECTVHLSVEGFLDTTKELERLNDKLEKLNGNLDKLKKAMSVAGYEEKVPLIAKDQNDARKAELDAEKEKLEQMIGVFKTFPPGPSEK